MKLRMQTCDSSTGPSKGYGTQVTAKACWPLFFWKVWRNSFISKYSHLFNEVILWINVICCIEHRFSLKMKEIILNQPINSFPIFCFLNIHNVITDIHLSTRYDEMFIKLFAIKFYLKLDYLRNDLCSS